MSNTDPDLIISTSDTGASIRTVTDNSTSGIKYGTADGVTHHYQAIVLGFDDGGSTFDIASFSNPYPITLPTTTQAYSRIKELSEGLTFSGGVTAMYVTLSSATSLTLEAELDAIVGITSNPNFSKISVYGIPGATGIGIVGVAGATAVGVTGQVSVASTSLIGISGSASVTGQVAIDSSSLIGISGSAGVTGQVSVVTNSGPIGVTGQVAIVNGSTNLNVVALPSTSGLTSGGFSGDFTSNGARFPARGLSSGVRVLAESTGISTDYIYIGGSTSGGTLGMYPLREFESVFVETNNLNSVYFWPDNTQIILKFIGS